jgi:hypothetical protein
VSDEPAQLRLKAEACRRLADLTEDEGRKATWAERAVYWEQLVVEAEKLSRKRPKSPQLS